LSELDNLAEAEQFVIAALLKQKKGVGMPVKDVISRALSAITRPTVESGSVIHLALSGGVDSSVAAFLLRECGWDVRPVLMRCWAAQDDGVDAPCFELDVRASENAIRALRLRRSLAVFDFVPEYWSEVFDGVLLSGLSRGITPNQDLACNRAIKFGAFPARLAREAGTTQPPPFATGHYARIEKDASNNIKLHRAVDCVKDQTYFLASVRASAFRNAVLPIGSLLKSDVRRIAAHAGLPAATGRSSRGICFVGKRNMADFVSRYLATPTRARQDAENGAEKSEFVLNGRRIGPAPQGSHLYTLGQRARVGGAPQRLYVAGKEGLDIILQPTPPTTRRLVCGSPHWISASAPDILSGRNHDLLYKGNSSARLSGCEAVVLPSGRLEVRFKTPRPAVAPGQAVVLYVDTEVLGSAVVEECFVT
jgi:tRNA (5-methylaminomethyl-2-thiouridylate)-methyltransferase